MGQSPDYLAQYSTPFNGAGYLYHRPGAGSAYLRGSSAAPTSSSRQSLRTVSIVDTDGDEVIFSITGDSNTVALTVNGRQLASHVVEVFIDDSTGAVESSTGRFQVAGTNSDRAAKLAELRAFLQHARIPARLISPGRIRSGLSTSSSDGDASAHEPPNLREQQTRAREMAARAWAELGLPMEEFPHATPRQHTNVITESSEGESPTASQNTTSTLSHSSNHAATSMLPDGLEVPEATQDQETGEAADTADAVDAAEAAEAVDAVEAAEIQAAIEAVEALQIEEALQIADTAESVTVNTIERSSEAAALVPEQQVACDGGVALSSPAQSETSQQQCVALRKLSVQQDESVDINATVTPTKNTPSVDQGEAVEAAGIRDAPLQADTPGTVLGDRLMSTKEPSESTVPESESEAPAAAAAAAAASSSASAHTQAKRGKKKAKK